MVPAKNNVLVVFPKLTLLPPSSKSGKLVHFFETPERKQFKVQNIGILEKKCSFYFIMSLYNIVIIWAHPPKNTYLRHFSYFATKYVIIDSNSKVWNDGFWLYLGLKKDYNIPFSFQNCNIEINFEDPPYVIL